MPSSKLNVNGTAIACEDRGSGDPPVIFLHGFPFNHTMWRPQVDAVSKVRRVVACDLRGFGASEPGTANMTIDLLASDVIALLDALRIECAIGCGLSMGGYVLMNAVSRYPGRFTALVLADTQCIADSDENRANRFKSIEKVEQEGVPAFTEGMIAKLFGPDTIREKKPVIEEVRQMMNSARPQAVIAALKALAGRSETCNALKDLRIPALILCGKDDGITPPSQSELMNNALSGSTMHTIPQAGHLSNLEQTEEFNRHLLEFIRKN
jgi:3-oxoadipate enol-lactonase